MPVSATLLVKLKLKNNRIGLTRLHDLVDEKHLSTSIADSTDRKLNAIYKKIIAQIKESQTATGYFYFSGFTSYRDELELLVDWLTVVILLLKPQWVDLQPNDDLPQLILRLDSELFD